MYRWLPVMYSMTESGSKYLVDNPRAHIFLQHKAQGITRALERQHQEKNSTSLVIQKGQGEASHKGRQVVYLTVDELVSLRMGLSTIKMEPCRRATSQELPIERIQLRTAVSIQIRSTQTMLPTVSGARRQSEAQQHPSRPGCG